MRDRTTGSSLAVSLRQSLTVAASARQQVKLQFVVVSDEPNSAVSAKASSSSRPAHAGAGSAHADRLWGVGYEAKAETVQHLEQRGVFCRTPGCSVSAA